ncbi:carbohydrate ABC transporter permease [Paramicrobacterium agarici]|uniref:carbohydrate ABC transporter permease n=1 Tax=Paramicrobacterium agarici TaxID=630514 RepID=UPI001151556F|nr:carbohydrate ABC transporter permease [Microbacterium agarici]TQO22972.1 carbohydrate ABC transporter membrane protein 2 (CUT1 family) [Microbacterium agarici]
MVTTSGLFRIAGRLLLLGLLVGLAIVVLYPLLWMGVSSLKTNDEILSSPFAMPHAVDFGSYARAWERGVGQYFLNSALVTVVSVILTTLVSAWAAFGLSRIEIPFSRIFLLLVVGGLMLAPAVALVPLVKLMQSWGIYNTYWALILLYTAFRIPFTTFLIRSYMVGLPREVDEAAIIDGAKTRQIFWRIILPMSKPILASAVILHVIFAWNEFLFALVFVGDDSLKTLPVGLANLSSRATTDFPAVFAGMAIAAVPMIILFILGQRFFIRGLAEGVGK